MEEIQNKPVNVGGIWVYDYLPEGMRVATVEDMQDGSGPKYGIWFLIQHFTDNKYASYQVRAGFNLNKWMPWIRAEKMFVKEK